MKFLKKAEKILGEIENPKMPFAYFVLTFFFITTLRNFLEMLSGSLISPNNILFLKNFIDSLPHFYLSYIYIVSAIIILFYLAVREKIENISRVVFSFSLVLIIVPMIDLMLFFLQGKYFAIAYMFPGSQPNLFSRFFSFFGPLSLQGITPGMRIEVALVLLGSFIYFLIKKRGIPISLFYTFLAYFLIFSYCATPYAARWFFNALGLEYRYSSPIMQNFYLLLIFIIFFWLFYLYNKNYFLEILRDIKPFGLFYLELIFVVGTLLPVTLRLGSLKLTERALFSYLFAMIAVLFGWLFSIVIDKTINGEKVSSLMEIPKRDLECLSWIFCVLAIIYSAAINLEALFLMAVFMGNCYLYSAPPLRLKRVTFFSKLIIPLNSLILFSAGYLVAVNNFN